VPGQSPLFHAFNAARYDRQTLIESYEDQYSCCLIVVIDAIFWPSVTLVEELIYDADPQTDLHLILNSPGGDGETAVRLVKSVQSRCKELTVIIPDQAKSAATLLALGAHHILMSPFSDLGPVDPQFQIGEALVSAKDIIAAVDDAAQKMQAAPATYPLYVSLLSDVTGLMVQQARSALDRTQDLLNEALRSNPDRSADEIEELSKNLTEPLIERPKSHAALFGYQDAKKAGLPVIEADLKSDQWQLLWRLWTKYFAMNVASTRVYEGRRASQIHPWPTAAES
jgi:membrane-bound ClpP family serine protease